MNPKRKTMMSNLQPFDRGFNIAVAHLSDKLLPRGYDVGENAPNTFEGMITHYVATGRVKVFPGDVRSSLADAELYQVFRAWHDMRHITGHLLFTAHDEWAVIKAQKADILARWDGVVGERFCALAQAEIASLLQSSYQHHGQFPDWPTHRSTVANYLVNMFDLSRLGIAIPSDVRANTPDIPLPALPPRRPTYAGTEMAETYPNWA
jgi:hypothetical protein